MVGFWGFSPTGSQMEFTTLPTSPTVTPYFQARFSDSMTFFERLQNTYLKVNKGMSLLSKGNLSQNEQPAFQLITYLDAAFNLVVVADVHLSRYFVNKPPLSELYRDDEKVAPRLREIVPAARYHETSDPHL